MPYGQLKRGAYTSWRSMIARCFNPNHENYANYGEEGIKPCKRWLTFKGFWSDMGHRPNGHVLDRKNHKVGYSKSNCRWATFKQSTERRSITVYAGKERVFDMAARTGIPAHRIYSRLARGWSAREIEENGNPIKHGYSKDGALNPNLNARKYRHVS